MWFQALLIVALAQYGYQAGVTLDASRTSCPCGQVNRQTRIVGGTETTPGKYPWMAEIKQSYPLGNSFGIIDLCGGALVNTLYVITAAHCFVSAKDPKVLSVYLGDHDSTTTNEIDSITRNVATITPHPQYNQTSQANDIAIVKLASAVVYQWNILPICIPPSGLNMLQQNLIVLGWGSTFQAGPASPVLREVSIPVIPNPDCKTQYAGTVAKIDQSTICAGTKDGSKDACQGDSGGPAAYLCDSDCSLAGVVSYGIGCGNPQYPGVFTNVSNYIGWITQNIPPKTLCGSQCYPNSVVESDCGWANDSPPRSKRIVGGQITSAYKYPWMVSVYIDKTQAGGWTFTCAGSIINNEWIVTSARCISGIALKYIFMVVGDYDLNNLNEPGESTVFPSQIVIHPNFDKPFPSNDIALVKLSQKLTFNSYVKPVCLPSSRTLSSTFSDVFVTFAGWGRTSTNGTFSNKLKEVQLYALSKTECQKFYSTTYVDSMVCTASSMQGDVCEGDSGGPLMLQGQSRKYYIAAVQSFRNSKGCGEGMAAGNTRITPYLSWIQTTTGVAPASTNDVLP